MRITSVGIVSTSSNAKEDPMESSAVLTTSSDQLEGQMTIAEYLSMLTPDGKIIPDNFMNPPE